jgi:hypothetical protein
VGLLARSSTSARTCYQLVWDDNASGWNLARFVAGTGTVLQTVSVPGGLTVGTGYLLQLSVKGTTISASVNGTQIISVTDSAVGQAGVVFYGVSDPGAAGVELSNLVAA